METNILKFLTPTSPLLTLTRLTPPRTVLTLPRALRIKTRATNSSDQSDIDNATTSGIRFRSRSRKRAAKTEEDGFTLDEQGLPQKTKQPPKKWEEMSFQEKALELYVGEKGALFWLNKFAYASIYIVIGAWICFRFVGPALNLYQLDAPPLSPSDVLKGSS